MNKKELLKRLNKALREDKSLREYIAYDDTSDEGYPEPILTLQDVEIASKKLCSEMGPNNVSAVYEILKYRPSGTLPEKTVKTLKAAIKSGDCPSFGRSPSGWALEPAESIPSFFYMIGRMVANGEIAVVGNEFAGEKTNDKMRKGVAAAIVRDPEINNEKSIEALAGWYNKFGSLVPVPLRKEKGPFLKAFMSEFKKVLPAVGDYIEVKSATDQLRIGWGALNATKKAEIEAAWEELAGPDKLDKAFRELTIQDIVDKAAETLETPTKRVATLERRESPEAGSRSGTFATYMLMPTVLASADGDTLKNRNIFGLPFVFTGRKGGAGIGNEQDFAHDIQDAIGPAGDPFTVQAGGEKWEDIVDVLWNKDFKETGGRPVRDTGLEDEFKRLGDGKKVTDPKADAFLKTKEGRYIGISIKQPDAESWLSGDAVMAQVKAQIIKKIDENSNNPPAVGDIKFGANGPEVFKEDGKWKKQDIYWEIPSVDIKKAVIFGGGTNMAAHVFTGDFTKAARAEWDEDSRTLSYPNIKNNKGEDTGENTVGVLNPWPGDEMPDLGLKDPVFLARTGELLAAGGRRSGGIRIAVVPRKRIKTKRKVDGALDYEDRAHKITSTSPFSIDWDAKVDGASLTDNVLKLLGVDMSANESTLWGLYQSLLNEASSPSLLKEELTRADKKEIKDIARKEAIKEIERVVGNDFSRTIQEEIKKSLGQKATKQQVAEISKQVLKKLYREMSHSYNPLIDRIKI